MIRILHVVTVMNTGGIETLLMNVYRNIDRKQFQFDFLVHSSEEGFYDGEIKKLGGRIYYVPPINPFKQCSYLRALRVFFEKYKDDYRIIHSHRNTFSTYPLKFAKKNGIPVRIAHSHTALIKIDIKRQIKEIAKLSLQKYSTHLFACSLKAGTYLFGKGCEKKDNFFIFKNAIDGKKFIYNENVRNEYRKKLSIDKEFIIMHTGGFTYQKNHSFLIDIFNEIIKINNASKLFLVGEGEDKLKIKKKINHLGLDEKVVFLGIRSDVHLLLQAADVFVFPSNYEGLGIAAVESQSAGLPTFISDVVPKEVEVTNLVTFLSLKSSPQEWAKIIIEKTNQTKRINTYDEIISSGYDIESCVEWLTNFYKHENSHSSE